MNLYWSLIRLEMKNTDMLNLAGVAEWSIQRFHLWEVLEEI